MRWNNDVKIAQKVPEIDIVLGGHDHDFEIRKVIIIFFLLFFKNGI